MVGALQIKISHANDCLAVRLLLFSFLILSPVHHIFLICLFPFSFQTSRVRSNIQKMNNVLQRLEVPKEMDQAYLLRSLVSCLESLEIQKVHKVRQG